MTARLLGRVEEVLGMERMSAGSSRHMDSELPTGARDIAVGVRVCSSFIAVRSRIIDASILIPPERSVGKRRRFPWNATVSSSIACHLFASKY